MAHNHNHEGHAHSHSHAHNTDVHGKKLLWVTLINLGIMVLEIVGGLISNSLALLSDAVHKLGDTLSLVIAWLANHFGKKQADFKKTFGYKRIEILAAFFNALLLVAICIFLLFEAYERFREPEAIRGGLMLTVALIGLVADWICVLILQKNKKENINVKAAYLHLLGDTLSSVAVIIGGLAILLWDIVWVDPVVTALVSLYLMYHTWDVLKESIDILMQAAPKDIDLNLIQQTLEAIPEVEDVHHMHIWRLNDSKLYFESHVNLRDNIDIEQINDIRFRMEKILNEQFGIDHTTLQFEYQCCQGHSGLIAAEGENKK